MSEIDLGSYIKEPSLRGHLDAGNWKQAVKAVDKRLKKTPNDTLLLVIKTCIYVHLAELSECQKLCQTLLARDPPVTQLEEVRLIYYAVAHLEEHDIVIDARQVSKLWEVAVRAQKTNDGAATSREDWLHLAFRYRQWHHAQRAMLLIRQSVSDNDYRKRIYHFGQILAYWLASRDIHLSRDQATFSRQIALRMLDAAAKSPLQSFVAVAKAAPVIAISQELSLLCYIYKAEKEYVQLVAALGRDNLRALVQSDPHCLSALLEGLEEANKWDELWMTTKHILEKAQDTYQNDDFWLWKTLVYATMQLQDEEKARITRQFLDDQLLSSNNSSKSSRGAHRALLRFFNGNYADTKLSAANGAGSERLRACMQHFRLYSDHNSCIDDLQDIISTLTAAEAATFRENVSEHVQGQRVNSSGAETFQLDWLVSEVNALKLDFQLMKANIVIGTKNRLLRPALEPFICNCLRLYGVSRSHTARLPRTDTDPGDEACILAVRGLEWIYTIEGKQEHVISAACLLDFLVSESPHNSKARLLLIRLQRHLGLQSLALQVYNGLRIKGIMIDSMCPVLLARLASSHPFPYSKEQDPNDRILEALKFYVDSLRRIPQHQETALENENYSQVLGFDDLDHRLRYSLTRSMLMFESRRIARLRGNTYSDATLCTYQLRLQQARATGSHDAELALLSSGNDFMNGPRISHDYVEWLAYTDVMFDLASSKPQPRAVGELEHWSKQTKEYARKLAGSESLLLTSAEMESARMAQDMAELCFTLNDVASPNLAPKADQLLQVMERLKERIAKFMDAEKVVVGREKTVSTKRGLPSWEVCHRLFLELECLQACRNIAGKAATKIHSGTVKATPKDDIRKCEAAANALKLFIDIRAKTVRAGVQDLVDELGRSDYQIDIGEGILKDAICDLVGEQSLKEVLDRFKLSAVDALSGILKVKIT